MLLFRGRTEGTQRWQSYSRPLLPFMPALKQHRVYACEEKMMWALGKACKQLFEEAGGTIAVELCLVGGTNTSFHAARMPHCSCFVLAHFFVSYPSHFILACFFNIFLHLSLRSTVVRSMGKSLRICFHLPGPCLQYLRTE